jgi:hypothetical protein
MPATIGGDQRHDVEVDPPPRRAVGDAEHGRGDDPGVESQRGSDSDRDYRLAEGDDHDQAVPLGEMARGEPPAGRVDEEVGGRHVQPQRDRPQASLKRTVEEGRRGKQRDPDRSADRQPVDGAAQGPVVAAGEHEEGDVGGAHEAVGDGEGEGEPAEGLRDAEGDDQQRGHRGEDDDSHRPLLGVDDAGQPRVADPRPPQHAEHQHASGQSLPARVMCHQCRALSDRKDEDEVEEQLQRSDPLALSERRA